MGGSDGIWDGNIQLQSGAVHAAYWSGNTKSAVDLAPGGVFDSYAIANEGGTQVGATGSFNGGDNQAALWRGSAASYVNLNPQGYTNSLATAISGGYVVGWLLDDLTLTHAVIWNASTHKYLDISTVLPSKYNQSGATCVLATANGLTIGGWATVASTGGFHPIVWQVPSSSLP